MNIFFFTYVIMVKMKRDTLKNILLLFITFLKIGALTFGGGYAMIPIIERDVVEKRRWLKQNDILDILAISESTPGPISVNTATFVGFKVAGFWGSFFATLGLILPSFIIIYTISFFYKTFMSWEIVSAAFKGIKASVIILLINAFMKLKKSIKLTPLNIIIFILTLAITLAASIFQFSINIGGFKLSLSILLILCGAIAGVVALTLARKGEKK